MDEIFYGGMEGLVLGAANGAEDAVPARQNALSPVPPSELLPEPIAGVPEAGDPASSAAHQPADGEVFDGGMEGLVLGAANGAANGAVDADDGRRWAGEGAAGHEAEAVVASGDAAANPDEVEVDDEEEGGQEEEGSINVPLDEIAFADDVTVAWEKAKRDYSDCIRIIGETYPTAASFLKRLGGLGFELSGLLKEGEDGDAISSEVSLAPCPCEAHFTAHTQHIHSTYTGHTPHIHILRECVYAGKPMCIMCIHIIHIIHIMHPRPRTQVILLRLIAIEKDPAWMKNMEAEVRDLRVHACMLETAAAIGMSAMVQQTTLNRTPAGLEARNEARYERVAS